MDRSEDAGKWLFIGLCFGALIVLVAYGLHAFPPHAPLTCDQPCLDRRDLSAQEGMAQAAWAMVIVTVASVTLGAWSLYLIRENLVEARKLSRDGERSAHAAENAVREAQATAAVARDMAMIQTRAYMSVTGMECLPAPQLGLMVRYANAGQSPARSINIELVTTFSVGMADPLLRVPAERVWSDVASNTSDIAELAIAPFLSETAIRQAMQNTGGRLLVEGEITYRDVFDREWRESFAYNLQIRAGTYAWTRMVRLPSR